MWDKQREKKKENEMEHPVEPKLNLAKALQREVHSSSVQFKVKEVKSFVAAHESLKDQYFSVEQIQIPGPH